MSIPAISSMETSRDTMALRRAKRSAPTAIVTDSTAGKATGIDATARINANWTISINGLWRNRPATTMVTTRPTVVRIKKFPMRSTAR